MEIGAVRGERCRRLVFLTVTLDVVGRPVRASVVEPILDHHGMQPLESGLSEFGGRPDRGELTTEVLSVIADLYGVDRAYLTDIGSNPVREEEITEDLFQRRRNRSAPEYNTRLGTGHPLPAIRKPITEQVDIVNQYARRRMWSHTLVPSVTGFFLLDLTVLAGFFTVAGPWGIWVQILTGTGAALTLVHAATHLRQATKAIWLIRAPWSVFGAAIQAGLREHVASKLHHYLTTTDLPHDFFTTTIGHELPIDNGTLDRLAQNDKDRKANIIQDAIATYLSSPTAHTPTVPTSAS